MKADAGAEHMGGTLKGSRLPSLAHEQPEVLALLRRLFWTGGLALVGLAATLGVLGLAEAYSGRWVSHSREIARLARAARALATDRETGIRGYLLTHDVRSLAPEVAARDRLAIAVDSLIALTADNPVQQRRAIAIRETLDRWQREYAAPVLGWARADDARAQPADSTLAGKPLFDAVRAAFGAFIAGEDALYTRRLRRDGMLRLTALGATLLEILVLVAVLLRLRLRLLIQATQLLGQQGQLEEQAVELEHQIEEAQALTEQLEASNQELSQSMVQAEQAREEARAAEGRYRSLVEHLAVGVVLMGADGRFQTSNRAAERILGLTEDQMRGRTALDPRWHTVHEDGTPFPPETHPVVVSLRTGEPQSDVIMGVYRPDETLAWISVSSHPLFRAGERAPYAVVASFLDITERKRADEEIAGQRAFLRQVIDTIPSFVFVKDRSGRFTLVNQAVAEAYGTTVDGLLGRTDADFSWNAEEVDALRRADLEVMNSLQELVIPEERITDATGAERWLHTIKRPLANGQGGSQQLVAVSSDITVRKHAEAARRTLEVQLRQAQKMEAVGQLAGGVAHDFNNLLTVITSYSEMLLMELPPESPAWADVQEVKAAADRAAALTRQLLAFSRQQILEPRVLDLNALVRNMEKMLRRLIREDIVMTTVLDAGIGRVHADPGQIEQVVMNLVVNARDAMPEGGRLTIETANVELDETYVPLHAEATPGSYVMLAVSDTGTGMDEATRARIFEPFYTTKEQGKGTGLGLSTVYGIVKQSGGSIWLYSEVGTGTTFKIYLPRVEAASETAAPREVRDAIGGGSETILLVEDEAPVRTVARRILEKDGYTILEAANGAEALESCERHTGPIELLLTDMVMPRMNGRELASRVRELRPDIALLFMSGYTEDTVLRQSLLEPGAAFVNKPFTHKMLTAKVRALLGERTLTAAGSSGSTEQ